MSREIWYVATDAFDAAFHAAGSWEHYIQWSKLHHLAEVVSLDRCLNNNAFEVDLNSEYDWQYIVTDGSMVTRFLYSFDYILEKTRKLPHFNLLAVIREPAETKAALAEEYDFIGYDLIETHGDISALTNCGGFDESFLPHDLNSFGLVTDWARAKQIQTDLLTNNPNEDHADCYLYEVWRHKTIGRKRLTF